MKSSGKKVLVIGLDGATFDLIDPWVKQGKLPTLSRCMKAGVRSELLSTPLSNSAQAWSTFSTGKNPGKHGIFDFFERTPGSYDVRFVNASFRRGENLWEVVSEAGKRVVVMNVPMSYPPKAVNGVILSGLDAPGITDGFAHPADIMEEIKKNVGTYVLEPGIWGYIRQGKRETALNKLLETIDIRAKTAKYLMSTYPWEFFLVVFTESDKVQHHFWKYMDRPGPHENAILEVYQHLDDAIRKLLEGIDDETQVYVISDHGGGASTDRTFYINQWLCSEGFLKFKKLNAQKRFVNKAIEQADGLIKTKLPRRAKEILARTFPGLRGKVESVMSLSAVDWGSTQAYSRENHPAVFINVKGREPLGIVPPGGDYYTLREAIAQRLSRLVCPETGEKIAEHIAFREDVFSGTELDKAPDIIFKWKDNRYIHRPSDPSSDERYIKRLSDGEMGVSESFHRPSGVHRDEGILIAFGPEVRRSARFFGARLMDMAPTILHALGIPVPSDMDGKVLVDVFPDEVIDQRPVMFSDKEEQQPMSDAAEIFDADEETVIRDRLKGLGYID